MKRLPLSLLFFLILGCSEAAKDLPPLSEGELEELHSLQTLLAITQKKVEAYEEELARIEQVTPDYANDSITLEGFSIYKAGEFDDGRERVCYRGFLVNSGSEILEEVSLRV